MTTLPTNDLTPSQKWDGLYTGGAAYKPLNLVFLNRLLERIEALTGRRPATVLDLGCGTGDSLAKLAAAGITDVRGMDCSSVALEMADKAIDSDRLSRGDLDGLDRSELAEGRYDLILCKLTVAFVRDRSRFLKTVKEMMNAGSVLCVITPVLYDGVEYRPEDKPSIAVSYAEFRSLLEETFGRVEEFHHDYFGERGDTVTFLATQ
ncbi:class I SAM-dependent methyltransferase [Candidatus Uhrbacteria bacterium]|nr:class I SAM-dependent methyltransferase [Candidatus Uhrbacteria bacterium]